MKKLIVAFALTAAACNAGTSPSVLDHATLLAVRAEPPRIEAGSRARIEVLAADAHGVPVVIETPRIAPRTMPEQTAQMFDMNEAGSYVVAPEEAELELIRVAASLPPGAPIPFQISASADVSTEQRAATKIVLLGDSGENPVIEGLAIDGAELDAGEPIRVAAGTKPKLSARVSGGSGELSYSWHSSVGELDFYRSPEMVIDAVEAKTGAIVLVVRDPSGGTSWQIFEATVE